jgi:hypothetical protein
LGLRLKNYGPADRCNQMMCECDLLGRAGVRIAIT